MRQIYGSSIPIEDVFAERELPSQVQLGSRVSMANIPQNNIEGLPPQVQTPAPDGDPCYDCGAA